MTIFQSTLNQIKDGLAGLNKAISTTLPRYDSYISGIYKGTYFLYGAESGIGKTKFVRYVHIDKVYEEYKRINDASILDVHFIDFSLEMTPERNMLGLISRKLYVDYNIEVTAKELLSRDRKLPTETFELIKQYYKDISEFESKLTVYNSINPKKYHDKLLEFAKKNGTFEHNDEKSIYKCGKYTPNNKNLLVSVLIDTINLSSSSNIKKNIDAISKLSIQFRDVCKFVIVMVQQFNSEISSTDRSRNGSVTPMLRDFEDSKRSTKDADIVCGLFSPMRHRIENFRGYDILDLKNTFRSLHILKNRDGVSDVWIPLNFIGSVGIIKQLEDYDKSNFIQQ